AREDDAAQEPGLACGDRVVDDGRGGAALDRGAAPVEVEAERRVAVVEDRGDLVAEGPEALGGSLSVDEGVAVLDDDGGACEVPAGDLVERAAERVGRADGPARGGVRRGGRRVDLDGADAGASGAVGEG